MDTLLDPYRVTYRPLEHLIQAPGPVARPADHLYDFRRRTERVTIRRGSPWYFPTASPWWILSHITVTGTNYIAAPMTLDLEVVQVGRLTTLRLLDIMSGQSESLAVDNNPEQFVVLATTAPRISVETVGEVTLVVGWTEYVFRDPEHKAQWLRTAPAVAFRRRLYLADQTLADCITLQDVAGIVEYIEFTLEDVKECTRVVLVIDGQETTWEHHRPGMRVRLGCASWDRNYTVRDLNRVDKVEVKFEGLQHRRRGRAGRVTGMYAVTLATYEPSTGRLNTYDAMPGRG